MLATHQAGRPHETLLTAGQTAGGIKEILPVAEIMRRLVTETEAAPLRADSRGSATRSGTLASAAMRSLRTSVVRELQRHQANVSATSSTTSSGFSSSPGLCCGKRMRWWGEIFLVSRAGDKKTQNLVLIARTIRWSSSLVTILAPVPSKRCSA
jgi:hypothetical protein